MSLGDSGALSWTPQIGILIIYICHYQIIHVSWHWSPAEHVNDYLTRVCLVRLGV